MFIEQTQMNAAGTLLASNSTMQHLAACQQANLLCDNMAAVELRFVACAVNVSAYSRMHTQQLLTAHSN
jgi:hypothetical protein